MKILIINRALGTLIGGGETTDLNAARYLIQRGHDVTLITGRPLFGDPKNIFDNLPVVYVKTPGLRKYAYQLEHFSMQLSAAFYNLDSTLFELAVLRWMRKQRSRSFDVVQLCSLFYLPFRLLSEFNCPCISWLPGPPSRLAKRRILALVNDSRFALFTRGAPESALIEMGLKKGVEYEILEPGVDFAEIDPVINSPLGDERQLLGLRESDLVGITSARLVPVKNHAFLLKAIAMAKKKGVIWNWIFAGDGPLGSELKSQARALGIEGQIHWLGYRGKTDVYELLKSSNLFALTSTYENYSNAVLEAMAFSIPVIGTKVGFLQHMIAASQAGIVVLSNNTEQLADALVKMSDPRVRGQYGLSGRAYAECHDWSGIALKLENLYKKVQIL